MMSWMRRLSAGRMNVRLAPLLVAAIPFAACDDDSTDPGDVLSWEAELAGSGSYDDVIGEVAVVSNASSFTAAVELANAPDDAVFLWSLMEGTCAAPGDPLGSAASYPDLEVDQDGSAVAEADVTAVLSADDEYIVTVTDESGEDPVTVACAALELE